MKKLLTFATATLAVVGLTLGSASYADEEVPAAGDPVGDVFDEICETTPPNQIVEVLYHDTPGDPGTLVWSGTAEMFCAANLLGTPGNWVYRSLLRCKPYSSCDYKADCAGKGQKFGPDGKPEVDPKTGKPVLHSYTGKCRFVSAGNGSVECVCIPSPFLGEVYQLLGIH